MLTLILSIGIPLAYVIAGMFISRQFWFETRHLKSVHPVILCNRYNSIARHKTYCIDDDGISMRRMKTFLLIIFWPIAFASHLIKSFYTAPEKKLVRSRQKLEKEIQTLRTGAENFDRGSISWQTMMDMISVKTKELKGMD